MNKSPVRGVHSIPLMNGSGSVEAGERATRKNDCRQTSGGASAGDDVRGIAVLLMGT